jgi:glutamate synthase (ferredoxin)
MQLPHRFFVDVCDFVLPEAGRYGVGMLYMPSDSVQRVSCEEEIERIIKQEQQEVLGWRDVPVNNAELGRTAVSAEPVIRQVFIGKGPGIGPDPLDFERILYIIRKRASNAIRYSGKAPAYYAASMSSKTIVYKGMFVSPQVGPYYIDLLDERLESAIALVHSRFSTNTFPSWERAHPFRYAIHNGEINTVRGNENWMRAREGMLDSELFSGRLKETFPVIREDGSDSAKFDNTLELLYLGGRSLPHAAMMMVPEPCRCNVSHLKHAYG